MEYKYLKYKTKYLEFYQDGGKKKYKKEYKEYKEYEEHLSEPWFSLISLGLKTIEGRKNKGKFKDMKVGDKIIWYNNDYKERKIKTIIKSKREYNTFKEYLEGEGLERCLPGIPTLEHGLSVYFKFYSKQDEENYGVVAIEVKIID